MPDSGTPARCPLGLRTSACACAASLLALTAGHATDFYCTKTADSNDGVCAADCSLREAVIAANANPGADRIILGIGSYELTLAGSGEQASATGDLDLTDDVEIWGLGAALTRIDANQLERVLEVDPMQTGVVAGLVDLTITGGAGGGIYNLGALQVMRCVVAGNASLSDGAGIDSELGAELYLYDSTVRDNFGGDGGGLGSQIASIHLFGSTVSGNSGYLGGGIFAQGLLTATNSTISGNFVSGTGSAGGAIYSTGEVRLTHVTLADNGSPGSADLDLHGTPVTFSNTLIVGDCHFHTGVTSQSEGGNLESPGDTCHFIAANDQPSVADPGLAGLADNGGRTWTWLPTPGSPAIDLGSGTTSATRDQRWVPRPFDGDGDGLALPDIGAVEVAPTWIFGDDFEIGSTFAWSDQTS